MIKFNFPAANNEAEYEAILIGLKAAEILGLKEFDIISDSRARTYHGTVNSPEALHEEILRGSI